MTIDIKYLGNKPERQRKQDAAFDLRALEGTVIPPGTRQLVATGTQVAIPEGYVDCKAHKMRMLPKTQKKEE